MLTTYRSNITTAVSIDKSGYLYEYHHPTSYSYSSSAHTGTIKIVVAGRKNMEQQCQAGNNEQKSSTGERFEQELFQTSKAVSQEVALSLSGNHGPHPESVDALIAREMNQLSMEERNTIYSDIHGVADIVKEAPGFINFQLLQLETELSKIKTKTAYDLAKSLSADYVNDPKFRLMFLRASSFDVNAAAAQMARFFDEKLELFGAEKLTKDIEWSDLDDDDIEVVETGWFQVLPEKDRSGRIIACSFPRLQSFRTARSMVRHSDDLFPPLFFFTEGLPPPSILFYGGTITFVSPLPVCTVAAACVLLLLYGRLTGRGSPGTGFCFS
jgi:hypothetical protein